MTSSFPITGELKQMFEQFILEWIQLHYHEVKEIQRVRNETPSEYRRLFFKEKSDSYREMIEILFQMYNREFVKYIMKQKKFKDCHKVPIIQYVIGYYKTVFNTRYVDDILNWKNFNKIAYLIEELIRVYVKDDIGEQVVFQIFEDFENEVVVLK